MRRAFFVKRADYRETQYLVLGPDRKRTWLGRQIVIGCGCCLGT